MSLIVDTRHLSAFCERQKKAEFITVDTEFMRERTYWPKLCLIQVGGEDEAVAVDPLAEGIDLAPLMALLGDPQVLKVFHAARQDIEIVYNMTGRIPSPMFDTQIAAMVCGFGEAASYETLAASLAQASVDKTSRFTDWARRPLSDKQLAYALGDVIHLRDIYRQLKSMLKENKRYAWVEEEMAVLTSAATYDCEPYDAWRRLKLRSDKPRLCAVVRELAAWREKEAQHLNVPRNRVLRDETLLEIAYHPPKSAKDIAKVRGLSAGFAESRQGAAILQAVERAQNLPLEKCPKGLERRHVTGGLAPVVDLLKVLLKHVSEEHGVASRLIATTDDLEDLAMSDNAPVSVLQGWRRELFGELALSLKHGEMTLGLKGKKITFSRRKTSE